MADSLASENATAKGLVLADTLALERMMIYVSEELERLSRNTAAGHVRLGLTVLWTDPHS